MSEDRNLEFDVERKKIELEEQKLILEREKVKVEKFKAWSTGGSIIISLLIAALTIGFSAWSQYKQAMTQFAVQEQQAKAQLELQERQAKAQFELKAAEIVMNTSDPKVTYNKATALLSLFPNRLLSNFAESFDPYKHAQSQSTMSPSKVTRYYPAPAIRRAPNNSFNRTRR
jgi:type II secretory pathway pseudopilin PulG